MPNLHAIPQCFVDVYPFEGGAYSLRGGAILRATVSKNVREDAGSFTFELAPGGPAGVDVGPSWSEVITPNSLVVIALARWQYRQIVMIGVVTNVMEGQEWNAEGGVARSVAVVGQDFAYYFVSQSYFAWNFLASTFAGILAPQLGEDAASLPFTLGILQGTPAKVASQWYTEIFAGANGILADTSFAYLNSRVGFDAAVATWFEEYPNFIIPMSDYFIATEETWMAKFRKILPFPFYETFATTAPTGFYPAASGGFKFTSSGLGPDFPASPVFLGRVNPLPRVKVDTSGTAPTFSAMDVDRWSALPLFMPDSGFIRSQLRFSTDEARNFYAIIPTWYATLYGASASDTAALLFLSAGAVDIASIHRYGYRPAWQSTAWFADPSGGFAKSGEIDVTKLVWDLMTRVYSYHEPAPLMGIAGTTMPLRPDVMPGCRYRYQPLKGEDTWDFYIEGVTHSFAFGGPSMTSLALTRGLPSTVYADVGNGGVLRAAHLGNAERFNGEYRVGLPPGVGNGLQILPFSSPSALNDLQSQAARIFVTPQEQ